MCLPRMLAWIVAAACRWFRVGAKAEIRALTLILGLTSNAGLRVLSVEGNEIGLPGASALAKALGVDGTGRQSNTTLSELWLRNNPIGDDGADQLGQPLRYNDALQLLGLAAGEPVRVQVLRNWGDGGVETSTDVGTEGPGSSSATSDRTTKAGTRESLSLPAENERERVLDLTGT